MRGAGFGLVWGSGLVAVGAGFGMSALTWFSWV